MKLVFYSLVLNHHQACLADEFYKILGDDYIFVETAKCIEKKGSTEDYSQRPYLISSWKSKQEYEKAMFLALNAEVCVFGGHEALPFEKVRMKKGLLSFDMGERMLKRGWLNLLSPRILKMVLAYHFGGWSKKPLYKLCCSAFAASDQYKLKMFEGKCYKWGYFTEVNELEDETHNFMRLDEPFYLMWCSRFIDWKHPEMAVELAKRLQVDGYNFKLNMYGTGVMKSTTMKLIKDFGLADSVHLKGVVPNEQIQQAMSRHDIFLFTSDKKEGWGAVANEAMSNKCCLVGSDEIGAVPYLVKEGFNGMVFKSKSTDALYQQVKYLLDHPAERIMMAEQGYLDMVNLWNPKNAAECLLTLIKDIQNDQETSIHVGPCSKA
ncbi:glycosyltransferase [Flammeovirga sp. MY04]|uniref:glycosyltransferase family 4 protein n=1 Tax=Flammeovirga sp. MY04 TaxID=1191459 RepID=UPI0008060C3F|nr:glycosyltransferase [Flammeovirga sp. MY04]ANQ47869.1 glycosyltransferase [Flammeovirga sp. MY04]